MQTDVPVTWAQQTSGAAGSATTMYVVLNAVVPCLIMPITMVLTIVIAFLVPLSVAPIVDYLTIVYYAA